MRKLSGRQKRRVLREETPPRYGTFEVARMAGVTWRTLYRWLAEGRLTEPVRSPSGQRLWSPEAVIEVIRLGSHMVKGKRSRVHAKDCSAEPEGRNG